MTEPERNEPGCIPRKVIAALRHRIRQMTVVFLCLFLVAPALAVEPDEVLDDPVLEARARELSAEIRCLVCQNESIDSSNAPLAKDLRIIVRERLVGGDSNQEVLDYLVARYGDFVLLRPPMKPATYFLWFGPLVILLLGTLGVGTYFVSLKRRAASDTPVPLSAEEQQRLNELLADTTTENPSVNTPQTHNGGRSESPNS